MKRPTFKPQAPDIILTGDGRRIAKTCLLLFFLFASTFCHAQTAANVLFVGNSYTEVNDLPGMVTQIARSMGDELACQSNTPGGCTFSQHCSNHSMELIRQGGWHFVVLQEQSQYPSFPQQQVESEVFPYAQRLVDSVYRHSPCAEPVFYMTWGRKNGDQGNAPYFPVLGTYEGMDSMLCERYTYMAEAYDASLCPVGRVWRYLRTRRPTIELYQSDGSHPSVAGTYAAACAFYTLFFHRNPTGIPFEPSQMAPDVASAIRHAVDSVVYQQLDSWRRPQPVAAFESHIDDTDPMTVVLASTSAHADSLVWIIDDGEALGTTDTTLTHTFADTGSHTITLIASRHCMADTTTASVHIVDDTTPPLPIGIASAVSINDFAVSPNPTDGMVILTIPPNCEMQRVVATDMAGRQIKSVPVTSTDVKVVFRLDDCASGVYLLHAVAATGIATRKIVVR